MRATPCVVVAGLVDAKADALAVGVRWVGQRASTVRIEERSAGVTHNVYFAFTAT